MQAYNIFIIQHILRVLNFKTARHREIELSDISE